MAASNRKSRAGQVLRSLSPSGRFSYSSSSSSSSSSAFASSSSTFSSRSANFFHRATSPTRVNLYGSTPSVRFSMDRSSSPTSRSISAVPHNQVLRKTNNNLPANNNRKRTCMCSPTNHPGSFRCSLHKNFSNNQQTASYPTNRLNARRSAMTNSLVRIGTVEGDLVKRALAALIRPSSHQQKRRTSFQRSPSRLSNMCKAEV